MDNLMTVVNRMIQGGAIEQSLMTVINTDAQRFEAIMRLETREDNIVGINVLEAYSIILELPVVVPLFDTDAKKTFLKNLLGHFFKIIPANCFYLSINDDESEEIDVEGRAIFDAASFFNHSCTPNLVNIVEGSTMSLISARRIRSGDHLSIAYKSFKPTNEQDFYTYENRQNFIQNNWNFRCNCELCTSNDHITIQDIRSVLDPNQNLDKAGYKDNKKFYDFEDDLKEICSGEWSKEVCIYGMIYSDLCALRAD